MFDKDITTNSVVCVVGAFPPPVHGMATINAAVKNEIENSGGRTLAIDISPPGLDRTIVSHLVRIRKVAWGLAKLIRFLLARKRAVVYMSVSGGFGQVYELLFVLMTRLFGGTVYIHHHSFSYMARRRLLMGFLVKAAGRDARHILLCPTMQAAFTAIYRFGGLTYIVSNSGVHDLGGRKFSPRSKVENIGFISNISESKGIFDFIVIFKELNKKSEGFRAFVAGPFEDEKTKLSFVNKSEKLNDFCYLGPVYGEEKNRFFEKIDLLVFPTKYMNEAEPLVIYEALSRGIPVLATKRGCISGMLEGGGGGTVPEGGVDEAIEQILVWRRSPELFRKISNEAYEKYLDISIYSSKCFRILIEDMMRKAGNFQII